MMTSYGDLDADWPGRRVERALCDEYRIAMRRKRGDRCDGKWRQRRPQILMIRIGLDFLGQGQGQWTGIADRKRRAGMRSDGLPAHGIGLCLVHQHKSRDRKSTRLNSSHLGISYAVFCLKKKKKKKKK